METDGREGHTDYGMVWVGYDTIFLFWNSQVPKRGSYTDDYTGDKILRWREPDLVLCHRIWTKSAIDTYDWTLLPIIAVELKNTNLGSKWGTAYLFDRDVMRRFLMVGTYYVANLLGTENWKESPRNSFPNAIKTLIQPAFGFTDKTKRIPRSRKPLTDEVIEKRKAGLIPESGSERDKILWRIKRLNLRILELGYQLPIGQQLPPEIESRLSKALNSYLDESLRRNLGSTKLPKAKPLPAYYNANSKLHHDRWTRLMTTGTGGSEFPQMRGPIGYRIPTRHR